MAQSARPVADDFDGLWTPTPIYARINVATPTDATFVSSSPNPQGDGFQVKLNQLSPPVAGPQILSVRLRQTEPGDLPVWVILLQGDTPVAVRQIQPGLSFAAYDFTLTDAEVAAITDYCDLHVRVLAGLVPGCCPGGLPPVLHATISASTCACVPDGTSFVLPYDAASNFWGTTVPCADSPNGPITFVFACTAGGDCTRFQLEVAGCKPTVVSCSCSPFQVVLRDPQCEPVRPCWSGGFTITITA